MYELSISYRSLFSFVREKYFESYSDMMVYVKMKMKTNPGSKLIATWTGKYKLIINDWEGRQLWKKIIKIGKKL